MVIRKPVEKFISEKTDLIDQGDWDTVYTVFYGGYAEEECDIGNLTDVLITAGIDPLEGKKSVHNYMYYQSEQSEVIIPEGITEIGISAFSKTLDLRTIHIPKTVNRICLRAFWLSGLSPLPLTIIYSGTREMWDNIIKTPNWDQESNLIIRCLGDEK